MCSRYSLTSPAEAVRQLFGLAEGLVLVPREQIRPTEPALIVRSSVSGRPEAALVRWGLIPPWVKDPREFSTLINARAETLADKPSFRGALRHKRCLVPADGFYEWSGQGRVKTPHFIEGRGGGLLAFAGLYETWLGADGSEIDTMAIITVAANGVVGPIHDRMPAILDRKDFAFWLDCRGTEPKAALELLAPAPDALLSVRALPVREREPKTPRPAKQVGGGSSNGNQGQLF